MTPNTPVPAPTVAEQHKHLRVAIQSLAFHIAVDGLATRTLFTDERHAALEYLRTLAPDDGPPEVSGDGVWIDAATAGRLYKAAIATADFSLLQLGGFDPPEVAPLKYDEAVQLSRDAKSLKAAPVRERVQAAPVRHLVHCNAGSKTPLGGDMCICLRELRATMPEVEPTSPIPSAQSEADARDAWQPIETAPGSHKMFLIYAPTSQRGQVDYGFKEFATDKIMVQSAGGWEPIENFGCHATHWQPLPAPPSTASNAGKEGDL